MCAVSVEIVPILMPNTPNYATNYSDPLGYGKYFALKLNFFLILVG